MSKIAVLSIDVEDWYHLEYFQKLNCDKSQKILAEGTYNFLDLIQNEKIKATFFVVGEEINNYTELIEQIKKDGNELAAHSYTHTRPLIQSIKDFTYESSKVKSELEKLLGVEGIGYRAPCFSLDINRYEKLKELGYKYDSSKINAGFHPLYGELNLNASSTFFDNVFKEDHFYEFELPTVKFLGRNIPISGGGWIRILPWPLYKYLIKKFISTSNTFFFFIHPFELTSSNINLPKEASLLMKMRFSIGRKKGLKRTKKLIDLLRNNGFIFHSFNSLINLNEQNERSY